MGSVFTSIQKADHLCCWECRETGYPVPTPRPPPYRRPPPPTNTHPYHANLHDMLHDELVAQMQHLSVGSREPPPSDVPASLLVQTHQASALPPSTPVYPASLQNLFRTSSSQPRTPKQPPSR